MKGIKTLEEWASIVHEDDRVKFWGQCYASLQSLCDIDCEIRLVQDPGRPTTYLVKASVVPNPATSGNLWFGTCTDISAQREVILRLEQLKERAEKLSRSKSEFLCNISHELRTPMNSILGFSELLLADGIDVRMASTLVHSNARKLSESFESILAIADLEANDQVEPPVSFVMEEMALDIKRFATSRALEKGLGFEWDSDLEQLAVNSYTDVIKRVLQLLLDNAFKFTSKGSVRVKVTGQSGPKLIVAVEDSGEGISQERQGLLFKPFGQLDSSLTRSHGGLGLGLLLCQKLAESVGGSVRLLRSKVGDGSVFQLEVPLEA